MKSFLSRLRGNPTPAPSRPSSASSQYHDKEKAPPPIPPPKKGGPAQSLPQRSLTPIAAMHSQSSSSASDSTRPRSALGQLEGDVEVWNGADEHGGRTVSASGEVAGKKVTFRSPAPTPTTSVVLEDFAQLRPDPTSEGSRGRKGSKMEGERSASASPKKPPVPPRTSKPTLPTRSSLPTAPMFVSSRKSSLQPARRVSQHTVPPQPLPAFPTKSSVLSPTPSDVSAGSASARSYLPPPNSWSEMAEQDLIANLGPKERTRQEVLWEIVSSEERSVWDLPRI